MSCTTCLQLKNRSLVIEEDYYLIIQQLLIRVVLTKYPVRRWTQQFACSDKRSAPYWGIASTWARVGCWWLSILQTAVSLTCTEHLLLSTLACPYNKLPRRSQHSRKQNIVRINIFTQLLVCSYFKFAWVQYAENQTVVDLLTAIYSTTNFLFCTQIWPYIVLD